MKKIVAAIITAILTQLFFLEECFAETPDNGLVEVRYPVEISNSYQNRRRPHGANVGFNLTRYIPYNWESTIDGRLYDEDYEDTPIQLYTLELGYKYNFVLGSFSTLIGFGAGEASTEVNGSARSMSVQKFLLKGMYIMDNLFAEPYLAPYIGGSVWSMKVTEQEPDSDTEEGFNPNMGLEYSVGALIQLNWLETDTASETLASMGIENTYLDIFVSQHFSASNSSDQSTASDLNYGGGLRLEF